MNKLPISLMAFQFLQCQSMEMNSLWFISEYNANSGSQCSAPILPKWNVFVMLIAHGISRAIFSCATHQVIAYLHTED